MGKTMKIGTITKKQLRKAERKASRDAELENQTGWVSKNKAHKNNKKYNRKDKHKTKY